MPEIRTDREIVDQTKQLALTLYKMMGYAPQEDDYELRESDHPTEQLMWQMARAAQIELTDTDPQDAIDNLEGEEDGL